MDKNEIKEFTGPAIIEVANEAMTTVMRVMDKGSDKSSFGQWFHVDSRRYHSDRIVSHVSQAMMQLDGNRQSPDHNGEDAVAHLERVLVRAAFLLFKVKRNQQ